MFWEVLVGFSSVQKSCDPAGWRFGWGCGGSRFKLKGQLSWADQFIIGVYGLFLSLALCDLDSRVDWSTILPGLNKLSLQSIRLEG